eukprot:166819_1
MFRNVKRIQSLNKLSYLSTFNLFSSLCLDNEGLNVKTGNGSVYWLSHYQCRENCFCNLCKLKPSKQRNIDSITLNQSQDIKITSANMDEKNQCIHIDWSDNHKGYIDLNAILNEDIYVNNKCDIWLSNPDNMTYDYDYNDMMSNDAVLLNKFYNELQLNGICLIRNCELKEKTVVKIANRLSKYVYHSVHGESMLIQVNDNAHNAAYTHVALQMHTDLPYHLKTPDYMIFHCIYNESTGTSLYCDGFNLINEMKTHFPDQYEILTNVFVPFRDYQQKKWDVFANKKIIEINNDQCSEYQYKIHLNEFVRSSLHWNIEDKLKRDFYFALSTFVNIAERKELQFEFEMENGDCIIFNNTRILHGRKNIIGRRKLELCYTTQDGINAIKSQIYNK